MPISRSIARVTLGLSFLPNTQLVFRIYVWISCLIFWHHEQPVVDTAPSLTIKCIHPRTPGIRAADLRNMRLLVHLSPCRHAEHAGHDHSQNGHATARWWTGYSAGVGSTEWDQHHLNRALWIFSDCSPPTDQRDSGRSIYLYKS